MSSGVNRNLCLKEKNPSAEYAKCVLQQTTDTWNQKNKIKSDCEQIAKDGCYRESCAFVLNLHHCETDKIVVWRVKQCVF